MYLIEKTKTYKKWESKLKSLQVRALIDERIYRVAHGLLGDVASIGEGIFELRIHYGPGYRVYFKQYKQKIIIILCGGNKSTQNRDIEMAKKLVTKIGDQYERETLSF